MSATSDQKELSADAATNNAGENPPAIPKFLPQTELSAKARDAKDNIVGDFAAGLESLAREIGTGMDEIQTPHVFAARNRLLASGVSELANFAVVILLPIGLFILGIVCTPLIDSVSHGKSMHWGYVVAGIIGGALFSGSLVLYVTKSQLLRLFPPKIKPPLVES